MFKWLRGHDFDSVQGIVRFAVGFERASSGDEHYKYVHQTYDELCGTGKNRRKIAIEALSSIPRGRFSEFFVNGLARACADEALMQIIRTLPKYREDALLAIQHYYRTSEALKPRGIALQQQIAVEFPEQRHLVLWCLNCWYGVPVIQV